MRTHHVHERPEAAGFVRRAAAVAAGACLGLGAPGANGQASFGESFEDVGPTDRTLDGPVNLIARGWTFRNQSQPEGPTDWYGSDGSQSFRAHTGSTVLAADFENSDPNVGGAKLSNWAILPEIPGQIGGDVLRFFAQGSIYGREDRLQVRYSPTRGTATGSSATDVGDFTTLLLDIDPVPRGEGWAEYSVALPGPGRVALRYYLTNASGSDSGGFFGIDTLTVGDPPDGDYPLPGPGEEVTWDLSMSPIVLDGRVVIEAGGTVHVDPGVEIRAERGGTLVVQGALLAHGGAGQRVVVNAPAVYPPVIEIEGGTLECDWTDFRGQVAGGDRSVVTLRDSTFAGDGMLDVGAALISQGLPFVTLERCSFADTFLIISDSWAVLRGVTVEGGSAWMLRTFAVTEQVTLNGTPLRIDLEWPIQPTFVNGVTGTGVSQGGGVELSEGNFLLGPDNVLQGNRWPVVVGGGLLPGSIVPASGNAENRVGAAAGGRGPRYWANVGVPYFMNGYLIEAGVVIEPGVTVEFPGGGGMSAVIEAHGTPEAPITFRSSVPGQNWLSLKPRGGMRLENCDISGVQYGLIADGTVLSMENCRIHDNAVGAWAANYGQWFVGKTLFTGNTVAAQDDGVELLNFVNPNGFEGNASAFRVNNGSAQIDANLTWWGHESGPQHPQNPDGQGDAITGHAGAVSIFPFLTERPDYSDAPPVVRVVRPNLRRTGANIAAEPNALLEPGSKYVLRWDATDEGEIVEQKVLFSRESNYPTAFEVLAAGLPGDHRSLEITVPDAGFAVTGAGQFFRVVAVDAAGQEGWDEIGVSIPSGRLSGELGVSPDLAGMTFIAGEHLPQIGYHGSVNGFPTYEVYVLFEADGQMVNATYTPNLQLPFVSTDAARLAVVARNNSNDVVWGISEGYFTVRLDPRLGLEPPQVDMQTPRAGDSFVGGGVAPITWTASDADDGLYSFDIQVSYDAGRTWKVLVEGLPPTARRFDWRLGASAGLEDVRVRVIARDMRFQNSTSGHDRAFAILPGDGCAPDYNSDGAVNTQDVLAFLNAWNSRDPRADFNGDGAINTQDVLAFLNAWTAGC
ncbi:MAG TPA: choice-of-anchor J domain-containing protein [Phycisphaerales bacterium]|nr:choice-of-anchor J domain-containing protein [Phycisphaerales bacterium]